MDVLDLYFWSWILKIYIENVLPGYLKERFFTVELTGTKKNWQGVLLKIKFKLGLINRLIKYL